MIMSSSLVKIFVAVERSICLVRCIIMNFNSFNHPGGNFVDHGAIEQNGDIVEPKTKKNMITSLHIIVHFVSIILWTSSCALFVLNTQYNVSRTNFHQLPECAKWVRHPESGLSLANWPGLPGVVR